MINPAVGGAIPHSHEVAASIVWALRYYATQWNVIMHIEGHIAHTIWSLFFLGNVT